VVDEALEGRIRDEDDLAGLETWTRRAVVVATLDEVFEWRVGRVADLRFEPRF
jgi:hypothetical protein